MENASLKSADIRSERGLADTSPAAPSAAPRSTVAVIVHSFFVVPFLIAVFSALLYVAVRLLTRGEDTAYDYLNDIKAGGFTQRWQAAFELAKLMSNPAAMPKEERFIAEMTAAFEQSQHDPSPMVRQYLALAMGRSGDQAYVSPLVAALGRETDDNRPYLLHALGMLRDPQSVDGIKPYVADRDARVRLQAVMALGNLGDPGVVDQLKLALQDPEPNVQWESAVALAKLGDASGRAVLLNLLDRDYWSRYPEVDNYERNQAILTAMQAGALLHDPELDTAIRALSQNDPNMNVRRTATALLKDVS
ncbi:MAG: HEAT repeat domain-containing protein [Candidatus Hydrogenedentes bacterium]|nr:HEAT repeat domain-containing protein [Candidatus Hydrogenedentota bacterium]